jgi:hypothetical protein
MIFSGAARNYECESCKAEHSDITITSLLPIGATIAFAGVIWGKILRSIIDLRWLALLLGFVVAIASFVLVYWTIDLITTRKIRAGRCLKCGGKLTLTSSGFYDTIIPQPWEIIIYAIVVVLPIVLRLAS